MSTMENDPEAFTAWLHGLDDAQLDAYAAELELFNDEEEDARLSKFSRLVLGMIAAIRERRAGLRIVRDICAVEFPEPRRDGGVNPRNQPCPYAAPIGSS